MSQGFNTCYNIDDLRARARRRAHKMVFDYIDGGSDDERSLDWNISDFDNYELHFRVLAGIETPNSSIDLLGHKLDVPFILSPSAGNRLFHHMGERAVARQAQKFGTTYCLSTLSSVSIEDIAAIGDGPKWFQLYVWRDKALVKDILARAKAAGFTGLILTVDLPAHGNRERDPKNGFTIPPKRGARQLWEALKRPAWTWDYLTKPKITYANFEGFQTSQTLDQLVSEQLYSAFDWRDAEWLLGEWNGTAIIKGVMRPDEAKRAIALGFNAIMVSNHGGRQLDTSPAPISVIEPMRQKIGGDGALILDGGVRRGTHIIKALALGADAVSFARPYLYGLAAGGEVGVARALELIYQSLLRDMTLLGAASIKDISRDMVSRR